MEDIPIFILVRNFERVLEYVCRSKILAHETEQYSKDALQL